MASRGGRKAWEARFAAEHGIEALRARWAASSRVHVAKQRADMGTDALRAKWRENAERWRRQQGMRPAGERTVTWYTKVCPQCRVEYSTNYRSQVHCSRSCSARATAPTRNAASALRRRIGMACPITVRDCDMCGAPFTRHGPGSSTAMRCSVECQQAAIGHYSREYQRRTHATAIRYWRVADSPAARDIATTYFELRQELRHTRSR